MSEHTPTDSAGRHGPGATQRAPDTLRGHMGTASLLFTVLAFNAPLAILAGLIPIVIAFGNGTGAPLTFIVVGMVVLLFAVGLNAMAIRMPRPGAFYSYIAKGLGRSAGLAAGFVAIAAYVLIGGGTYALFAVMAEHLMTTVFHSSPVPWVVWAILAWALATGLSFFNIDVSAKVLGVAMVLEVGIVLLWNVRIVWLGGPEGREINPFPSVFNGSFALALTFGALCLTGFESLQVFREETKNPERTVPRATYLSVIGLAVLYSVCSYAYLIAWGPDEAAVVGAADPTGSVLSSISTYLGPFAADTASLLLITSMFAACLAIQNIAARYLYALGKDRVIPSQLGTVNRTHGSPVVAAACGGILMLTFFLLPAFTGKSSVYAYTALAGIGAYILIGLWTATSLAIIVFFRKNCEETATLWQSMIAPTLALIGLGAIFTASTVYIDDLLGGSALLGRITIVGVTVVVAAGVGMAQWWKHRDIGVYLSIGSQEI
jgi:amino acid transporter